MWKWLLAVMSNLGFGTGLVLGTMSIPGIATKVGEVVREALTQAVDVAFSQVLQDGTNQSARGAMSDLVAMAGSAPFLPFDFIRIIDANLSGFVFYGAAWGFALLIRYGIDLVSRILASNADVNPIP